MPVEFGSVHVRKADLAAYLDAAAAAQSGAVDHDRVEADGGRYARGLGGQGAELDHDRRPDGEYVVDFPTCPQDFGERDWALRASSGAYTTNCLVTGVSASLIRISFELGIGFRLYELRSAS